MSSIPMRHPIAGAQARRGLIIALNGLAIWSLAVALSTYTVTAVGASDTSLAQYTVGIMLYWSESPTMGLLELTAYGGLSLAVIGPAWYWLIQPLKKLRERTSDAADSRSDGFVFSEDELEPDSVDGLVDNDPITSEFRRNVHEPSQYEISEWASNLFGSSPSPAPTQQFAVPEGDFLRSPGGREAATVGADGGEPEDDQIARAKYRRGDDERGLRSASEKEDPITTAVISNGGAIIDEPVKASRSAESDEGEEMSIEEPGADGEQDDSYPIEPAEAIGDDVSAARAKTTAVADALPNGHADASDHVAEAIFDIRDSADVSLRAVRSGLPNGSHSYQDVIDAIHDDQQQIEAAFTALGSE